MCQTFKNRENIFQKKIYFIPKHTGLRQLINILNLPNQQVNNGLFSLNQHRNQIYLTSAGVSSVFGCSPANLANQNKRNQNVKLIKPKKSRIVIMIVTIIKILS